MEMIPQKLETSLNRQKLFQKLMIDSNVRPKIMKCVAKSILNDIPYFKNHIFYVKKGFIAAKQNGKTIHFYREGDYLDLSYILIDEAYPFVCETLQTCELIVFKKAEVLNMVIGMGEEWFFLEQMEQKNLENIYYPTFLVQSIAADKDMDAALKYLSGNYAELKDGYYEFPKGFRKQDLYQYLNISNNLLKEMNKPEKNKYSVGDGKKKAVQIMINNSL
ncbi:Crp/Fnr family transcriptional regulator [Listeria booriae]|uniref:Crp/Fnr family transcriptional regulator n=1 Tax=Listeria booriae TaxID=1552123 RepID=A0A842F5V4_9LIST|nr:Crp/Fnr family transcriptional regulator [Listeria booriae]MBC1574600.1 Crp/Fnr family transcriptional regulator [Listeria booriae]MBC2239690.1 Crp/Fnr family transcriptional regulator [Listeria booriae]MBC2244188.1 Crp/Fnr family transcriptional regulator [Listeria booriae]